jgi:hypothetical protein
MLLYVSGQAIVRLEEYVSGLTGYNKSLNSSIGGRERYVRKVCITSNSTLSKHPYALDDNSRAS